jgi:hypothetical protein
MYSTSTFGEYKFTKFQYQKDDKNKILENSRQSFNCRNNLNFGGYDVSQNIVYVSTKENIQSRVIFGMKMFYDYAHDAVTINDRSTVNYFSLACEVT